VDQANITIPLDLNGGRSELEFERPRGISHLEVRTGFAQLQVQEIPEPLLDHRLEVLRRLSESGISIDFLKFTQEGLSCVVAQEDAVRIQGALEGVPGRVSVLPDRSILLVHAVNMRDEEGLAARVVSLAIASGAPLEQIGDMHDRILIVTTAEGAVRIQSELEKSGEALAR